MLAASGSPLENSNHIRKVEITRDLDAIADLIELCFPIHLDRDGETYLKQMRTAARDIRLLGWMSAFSDLGMKSASGFVWEEDGRIVGNLSLIPFKQPGRVFHMIANVAVYPEYRNRGIGRALTKRALGYLRRRHEPFVWLQVRDDNPAAYELYRSVGFTDMATRTTWRIRPFESRADTPVSFTIRHRRKEDWVNQRNWLDKQYPTVIRWNLPVDFQRFESGIVQDLINTFDGRFYRHWAVEELDEMHCVITWQKTETFANNLWLAISDNCEDGVLASALAMVLKRLPRRHPLSVDCAKGQSTGVFESLGFQRFHTLIWMRCDF